MTDYEAIYEDAYDVEYNSELPDWDTKPSAVRAGLAAVVTAAKAEGWDEGLGSGRDRWLDSREFGSVPVNPYRTENN